MRDTGYAAEVSAGVSEVIGTLVLVSVVVIGIAIVGLFLFASPPPSKLPALDTIISNRSSTIYILHKGGDPLRAGEYQILVDGGDQTANFSIMSPGAEPWSVGETLTGVSPSMPRRVVIFFNQSGVGGGGGGSVLALHDFVGTRTIIPPSETSWYNYSSTGKCLWQARKSITIDGSKVTQTLSNFPALIYLSSDPDLASDAQPTGNDIVFTASDGTTQLDHEIENFTAGTGSLTAWVRVPTLPQETDTVLYMYYGNSTVGSQQSPTAVWDATFRGVWHLKENTGITAADSTSNNNAGTPMGTTKPTQLAGKIFGSLNFTSARYQNVTVADADSLDITMSMTISGWMKTSSTDSQSRIIVAKWLSGGGKKTYWLGKINSAGVNYVCFQAADYALAQSAWNLADNQWHYVVGTANASSNLVILYVDGAVTNTNSGTFSGSSAGSSTLQIGKSPDDCCQYWEGGLDEIRVAGMNRTPAWIATEYANQASPSTFYSVGTAETEYWKC